MEINHLVVAGCAVLAMILGSVWFGPIFGKTWMRLNGVDSTDETAVKDMQKGLGLIMVTQFVLVLFQVWVLYLYLLGAADEMSMTSNALWIWAAFVVPTLAAAGLWGPEAAKPARTRFMIQAGYNLVLFVAFAMIIQTWG